MRQTDDTAGARRDPGLDGVVPFRFACHRCGHCCSGGSGFVWLEEREIAGLAAALGATEDSFRRRHVRVARDPRSGRERLALTEVDARGGRCSLLLGRNTCGVYAARPAHCRDFPYWDSVLADRDGFEAARATCPGIAVVVPPEVRARAFAELEALRARLTPRTEFRACCLRGDGADAHFASALEVDDALAHEADDAATRRERDTALPHGDDDAARGRGCRFGAHAPLSCRFADDGEVLRAEVRAIERRTGYPAAYAELGGLLAARERPSTPHVGTELDAPEVSA